VRTDAANDAAVDSSAANLTLGRRAVQFVRLVIRIIGFPLRLFLSIRRSMTAASVTLLLVGIITLNIIWGFPWVGMFSACSSLLFVGFAINRLMCPHLRINFSLPNSAPANQSFTVVAHVENRRRIPAIDLAIRFEQPPTSTRAIRRSAISHWLPTPPQKLSVIRPGERKDFGTSMASDRRGIHYLPDVVVISMFPFHLFRYSGRYPSEAKIAITPCPLRGDEDAMSRGLIDTLGDCTHRLLAGDALDYTGSREYEVGMPVRSWDFRAWARLGRPIVREFQSPSIQMVTLIIDTSIGHQTSGVHSVCSESEPAVERVLSLAAAAVNDLTRKLVRVCLYVSSESPSSLAEFGPAQSHLDCESLLIRLAAAEYVTPEDADQRIQQVIAQLGGSPGLIVTARRDQRWQADLPTNISVSYVPHGDADDAMSEPSRRRESTYEAAHEPHNRTAQQHAV
jgi:uncharacterized protein (DUF58 family)